MSTQRLLFAATAGMTYPEHLAFDVLRIRRPTGPKRHALCLKAMPRFLRLEAQWFRRETELVSNYAQR